MSRTTRKAPTLSFYEWFGGVVSDLRQKGFSGDEIRQTVTAVAQLSMLEDKHLREGERVADLEVRSKKVRQVLDRWTQQEQRQRGNHRKADVEKQRRLLSRISELVRREGMPEGRIATILRDSLIHKKASRG
jgi:hypothetical protein